MAEYTIVKDVFGQTLDVGDEVIYTYKQSFVKGTVVRFTRANNVVVDNYPSGYYERQGNGHRRWIHRTTNKSLGRYKECVLLRKIIN